MWIDLTSFSSIHQEAATRVLFEKIVIYTSSRLALLATRLATDSRKPGRWILELDCLFRSGLIDSPSWLTGSHMVLVHAPQLQDFRTNYTIPTYGSQLAVIRSVTASSYRLSTLQIALNQNSSDVLTTIPQFDHLNYLSLELNAGSPMLTSNVPTLYLHGLKTVCLLWRDIVNSLGHAGEWLIRGRFPGVQKIILKLPSVGVAEGSQICEFIAFHSSTCLELHIACLDHDLTNFTKDLLSGAQRLIFPSSVPPPTIFASSKRRQKHSLQVCTTLDGSRLWALLDKLQNTRGIDTALCLRVNLDHATFKWDEGSVSSGYAIFVVSLMHHALRIAGHGVTVVDEDGYTLAKQRVD
jgi:hypothetical protein